MEAGPCVNQPPPLVFESALRIWTVYLPGTAMPLGSGWNRSWCVLGLKGSFCLSQNANLCLLRVVYYGKLEMFY